MKKVVVCYKWVLDDADIRVTASRELDTSKAKYKVNEYDRNGIEAGVQLKKAAAAETLIGVTCGEKAKDSTKDALSRGLDSVSFMNINLPDNRSTGKTVAAMIKSIGDVDVIICSESSSDAYDQQVGPRVAQILGIPFVSYVTAIQADGDTLKLTRKLDDGIEHVEVKTPALLVVVPEINEAPIPSVKAVLGAKKKPSNEIKSDIIKEDLTSLVTNLSVLAPEVKRKHIRLNPEGTEIPAAVADLVAKLKADGVL